MIVILLLVLLLPFNLFAAFTVSGVTDPATVAGVTEPASVGGVTSDYSDVCSAYTVCQGFEGTGYDNSESWTETGAGTVNEDYTTTALADSQSLGITETGSSQSNTSYVSITQDNAYAYFMFRFNTDVQNNIGYFWANAAVNINRLSTGVIRVTCGASTADTVGTLSTNTTYHIWLEYEKGTGSNAVARVYFSTDTTKPSSGNNTAAITNCNETTAAAALALGGAVNSSTAVRIYDKVRVDNTAIGSDPE